MPWSVKNPIQPGDGDPRHGTLNGYDNHRCRCELCRAANAEYCEQRRVERLAALAADDPRHGKLTTYFNYKCRCPQCRAANAVYQRGRYLARKESERATS